MNLSIHFTLDEFCASDTACRLCINNDLPTELYPAAKATAEMLESVRAYLSDRAGKTVPITVTSGYRCGMLNSAIGSNPTSDHVKACAADIKAPAFGSPYEIALTLAPVIDKLGIGQLIYEYGQWVHVSVRMPDKLINRVITIDHSGIQAGIVKD